MRDEGGQRLLQNSSHIDYFVDLARGLQTSPNLKLAESISGVKILGFVDQVFGVGLGEDRGTVGFA